MTDTFAGAGSLIRLVLRRDRVRLPVWILAVAGVLVAIAVALQETFTTPDDFASRAALIQPGHGGLQRAPLRAGRLRPTGHDHQ